MIGKEVYIYNSDGDMLDIGFVTNFNEITGNYTVNTFLDLYIVKKELIRLVI